MFKQFVESRWYSKPGLLNILSPLEWLFCLLSKVRKRRQQQSSVKVDATVLVIGNISIGGTGKTPVLISLVKQLKNEGIKVGIISKGYGRKSKATHLVVDSSEINDVGDEPKMIFEATQVPVLVGQNRVDSAKKLIREYHCELIICDDGLQDYQLKRDLEWIVIDGYRQLGNQRLIPVGPLREPPTRLHSADRVIINGGNVSVKEESLTFIADMPFCRVSAAPRSIVNIENGEVISFEEFRKKKNIAAVAGLGNPDKFFKTLERLNFDFETFPFPDHYAYQAVDFERFAHQPIIMTAKDAVKCKDFAKANWWQLNIDISLPSAMVDNIREKMNA